MSQVSLPMRIALAVTLVFVAIWFVALRPKPVPTAPAPTPPAGAQSAPGKAAEQAQQAAATSQAAADKHEAATGDGDKATPATAAKPGAATADAKKPGPAIDLERAAGDNVSKPALSVLRDVSKGKVAVLLFWDRRLSDDRAVNKVVDGLSRRGGKVAVHKSAIAKLAQFEPITRGVPVVTSPTVLIIDRAGHARAVAGLTVPDELDELVGKALKVKP